MRPSEQELSNLLGILYEAAGEPELWSCFLGRLANYTRADCAGLLMLDSGLHSTEHSWRIDPELVHLHQSYYGSVDLWWVRGRSLPAGSVRISDSICSLAELRTTETYNDCLVRFDIEHGLFAVIENNGPRSASLSLFRSSAGGEFDTASANLLRFIAPHLERAFQLHRRLSSLTTRSTAIEESLNVLTAGLILLDTNGKIVFLNRAASTVLAERDGLGSMQAMLFADVPAESHALRKTIQQAISMSNGRGSSAGGTLLVSRRNRPPLHVLISPIHISRLDAIRKYAAVVFVNDPLRHQRPDETVLRTVYRLTRAECRVAFLLADGQSPRTIAEMIGVTEHTVRSQIKSIYAKAGVKRQSELIRLFLNYAGP